MVLLVNDQYVLSTSLDEVQRDGVIALPERAAHSLKATWKQKFRIWNWIAQIAGLEGSVVVNTVRTAPKGHGLNVEDGQVEDLVKTGIIDPTMVTRSALQNAASIAKNILTTEAIVAEAPEKAGAGGGMPDMGGMGGMM